MNFRDWNKETSKWEPNTSLRLQRLFLEKFYKRCNHSYEKPSMVDRNIQVKKDMKINKKMSENQIKAGNQKKIENLKINSKFKFKMA